MHAQRSLGRALGAPRERDPPVPGTLDDWNRVSLHRLARTAVRATSALSTRRLGIAALVATFAVVATGTVTYGAAHKTIALDVDGTVTRVSTYAGSVQGVLRDGRIAVGPHDTVSPGSATALHNGSDVVVRHARLVKVQVDGVQSPVWTTALSAGEALTKLAGRGADVRLVASRSAGRADLPIDLTRDGPVNIAADGQTLTAPDGARGVTAALREVGVPLHDLDHVSVQHSATDRVTVVVNRVAVKDVTDTQPIAFTSVDQPDGARYVGQQAVATPGTPGQRTIINRITTVDAVETARTLLSNTVTAAPVNQVMNVGTKARSASAPGAAAAATAAASPAPAAGAIKPGASNTGVPAGTPLTVHDGDLTVDTAGAVIDGLDIHGFVKINALGVTIKNSIIRGTATSTQRALVLSASDAASVTIQDSELVAAYPSVWIDGIRGWNITASRVNIHNVVDSVHLYGDNVTLESSWLHDNSYFAVDPNHSGGPTHNDNIQIQQGTNIRITGNTMSGANNSAMQFTQDSGLVSNVQVVRNWLDGGACTINVAEKGKGPFQSLVMTDNTFGRDSRIANCPIVAPATTVIDAARNVFTDGTTAAIHAG